MTSQQASDRPAEWLPPSQTKHHNSPAPETVAVLPAAPIATGSRHE